MGSDKHASQVRDFAGDHKEVQRSTEGGQCLVRRGVTRGSDGYLIESSCNHRWQGFRRALDADRHRYNWPAYKSLSDGGFRMQVRGGGGGPGEVERSAVQPGQWNVSVAGPNFRTSCNVPYWHESHHLVTNGLLDFAIAQAAAAGASPGDTARAHKQQLLKAGYNLNHMENIVILPLASNICAALGLPAHREKGRPNHKVYDAMVKQRLADVFAGVKDAIEQHTGDENAPQTDWGTVSKRLVNASRHLRRWVFTRGGATSLDSSAQPDSQVGG